MYPTCTSVDMWITHFGCSPCTVDVCTHKMRGRRSETTRYSSHYTHQLTSVLESSVLVLTAVALATYHNQYREEQDCYNDRYGD